MVTFATHRGTIFAIQCDVENACAKLLRQLRLQRQALLHTGLDATIMVAYRQRLSHARAQQHVTRMAHGLGCLPD